VSPCCALNQELTAGSPDGEKRQRDEAQTDPVEAEKLFRAVIVEICVLRQIRKGSIRAKKVTIKLQAPFAHYSFPTRRGPFAR